MARKRFEARDKEENEVRILKDLKLEFGTLEHNRMGFLWVALNLHFFSAGHIECLNNNYGY
jgi:hypothetical protein